MIKWVPNSTVFDYSQIICADAIYSLNPFHYLEPYNLKIGYIK